MDKIPSSSIPYFNYITFYSLNHTHIWLGIALLFFMTLTFFFLFSVYLRLMGHKNNISAPFGVYDYDPLPVTNYLIQLYWKTPENFEPRRPFPKRKETKKNLLATIWENLLFVPTAFLKMGDKLRSTTTDINTHLTNRINPHYERFTSGLNRVVNTM